MCSDVCCSRSNTRKSRSKMAWVTLTLLFLANLASSSSLNHHRNGLVTRLKHRQHLETTRIANTTVSANAAAHALKKGRYGHASVYLPGKETVLFIGGQVGETGTFITNDVLELDLSLAYPSKSNPIARPELSVGLPPHAWAAVTVDNQERVWVIGGVTQDCASDSLAVVLEGKWSTIDTSSKSSSAPPRRRQAQAVMTQPKSLSSASTAPSADIWVWGGIAEPYTCSFDTVGYMGIDLWDSASRSAQTFSWSSFPTHKRKNVPQSYRPPVSDYAAIVLSDGERIAFVGGQAATGDFVDMDRILVFNTSAQSWGLEVGFHWQDHTQQAENRNRKLPAKCQRRVLVMLGF